MVIGHILNTYFRTACPMIMYNTSLGVSWTQTPFLILHFNILILRSNTEAHVKVKVDLSVFMSINKQSYAS